MKSQCLKELQARNLRGCCVGTWRTEKNRFCKFQGDDIQNKSNENKLFEGGGAMLLNGDSKT